MKSYYLPGKCLVLYICPKTEIIHTTIIRSKIIFWTLLGKVSKCENYYSTGYNQQMKYETKRKVLKAIDDLFLKCIALLVAYIKLFVFMGVITYTILFKSVEFEKQNKAPRL